MAHAKADRYQRSTEDDTQKKKKAQLSCWFSCSFSNLCVLLLHRPSIPRQPKRVLS